MILTSIKINDKNLKERKRKKRTEKLKKIYFLLVLLKFTLNCYSFIERIDFSGLNKIENEILKIRFYSCTCVCLCLCEHF